MMFSMSLGGLLAQSGATVLAATALAWGTFRWLGQRWLEGKFAERLETFKHAKNREIEELRGEVNALLDRTVKLHTQEFEVLAQAWDKLASAFGAARIVAKRAQSYPSATWLEPIELEALLNNYKIEEHEKIKIRDIDVGMKRQMVFSKIIYSQRLMQAFHLYSECHNYLIIKGIFIEPNLKIELRKLTDMIWDALDEREFDMQYPSPGAEDRWLKADELAGEGRALHDKIERAVQARLWDRKLLDTHS